MKLVATCRRRRLRLTSLTAACVAAAMLAGCKLTYTDLSEPYNDTSQGQTVYPRPVNGLYLCLSSMPGEPVYQQPHVGPIWGYTRDVVAFYGRQVGR